MPHPPIPRFTAYRPLDTREPKPNDRREVSQKKETDGGIWKRLTQGFAARLQGTKERHREAGVPGAALERMLTSQGKDRERGSAMVEQVAAAAMLDGQLRLATGLHELDQATRVTQNPQETATNGEVHQSLWSGLLQASMIALPPALSAIGAFNVSMGFLPMAATIGAGLYVGQYIGGLYGSRQYPTRELKGYLPGVGRMINMTNAFLDRIQLFRGDKAQELGEGYKRLGEEIERGKNDVLVVKVERADALLQARMSAGEVTARQADTLRGELGRLHDVVNAHSAALGITSTANLEERPTRERGEDEQLRQMGREAVKLEQLMARIRQGEENGRSVKALKDTFQSLAGQPLEATFDVLSWMKEQYAKRLGIAKTTFAQNMALHEALKAAHGSLEDDV